jgi:hypothetical protein
MATTKYINGAIAECSSITGTAGNMVITSGTGNSRTLTLRTTTSGGTATNALIITATQEAQFQGAVDVAGALGASGITTDSLSATTIITGSIDVGGFEIVFGSNFSTSGHTFTTNGVTYTLPGVAATLATVAGSLQLTGGTMSGNITFSDTGEGIALSSGSQLVGESSNTVGLRNSTNPQTVRVYQTYVDDSNYRRVSVSGAGITMENAGSPGTGTLYLVNAGNESIDFYTNGSERMRVRASGGITVGGASDPGAGNVSVSGSVTCGLPCILPTYTVGTVPSAATYVRGLIFVSDGTANKRLAISDGTNWRFPDGNIVS